MALEQHIEELTGILKREIRSFTAVRELLMLEEKALIECDTEALANVLGRMEDVFSSIACLEKSRLDVIRKIDTDKPDSAGNNSISAIAGYVDDPLRRELLDAGHILSELNRDIQRKKATNTMLINQSILLVENDIRTVLTAANDHSNPDTRYRPNAGAGGSSHGVCIDQTL